MLNLVWARRSSPPPAILRSSCARKLDQPLRLAWIAKLLRCRLRDQTAARSDGERDDPVASSPPSRRSVRNSHRSLSIGAYSTDTGLAAAFTWLNEERFSEEIEVFLFAHVREPGWAKRAQYYEVSFPESYAMVLVLVPVRPGQERMIFVFRYRRI